MTLSFYVNNPTSINALYRQIQDIANTKMLLKLGATIHEDIIQSYLSDRVILLRI